MKITGQVLINKLCWKEMEKKNRKEPKFGFIYLLIQSINDIGCNNKPSSIEESQGIIEVRPFLEISYMANSDICTLGRDWPIRSCWKFDINPECIYVKEQTAYSIDANKIKSIFFKCMGQEDEHSISNVKNLVEPYRGNKTTSPLVYQQWLYGISSPPSLILV